MTPEQKDFLLQLVKLSGSIYATMKAIDLSLDIEKKAYDLRQRKKEETDNEFKG